MKWKNKQLVRQIQAKSEPEERRWALVSCRQQLRQAGIWDMDAL